MSSPVEVKGINDIAHRLKEALDLQNVYIPGLFFSHSHTVSFAYAAVFSIVISRVRYIPFSLVYTLSYPRPPSPSIMMAAAPSILPSSGKHTHRQWTNPEIRVRPEWTDNLIPKLGVVAAIGVGALYAARWCKFGLLGQTLSTSLVGVRALEYVVNPFELEIWKNEYREGKEFKGMRTQIRTLLGERETNFGDYPFLGRMVYRRNVRDGWVDLMALPKMALCGLMGAAIFLGEWDLLLLLLLFLLSFVPSLSLVSACRCLSRRWP